MGRARPVAAKGTSARSVVMKMRQGYLKSMELKAAAAASGPMCPYPYPFIPGGGPGSVEIKISADKLEAAAAEKGIEIPLKYIPVAAAPSKTAEEIEELRATMKQYNLIPSKPAKGEMIFSYASIAWSDEASELIYTVHEPQTTKYDIEVIEKVKRDLEERLDVDFTKLGDVRAKELLIEEIRKSMVSMIDLRLDDAKKAIISYYIQKDILGFGKIEPLMRDENIEDISCDGFGIPIYVYHRDPRLGSLKTNIVFEMEDELNSFMLKLAQKCNKSISIAEPLLDGALPDGSRIQATLGTDIARRGSNFTVRKFMDKPLTPTHMIKYGTLNAAQLAYLWLAIENGQSMLISGGTATGKTSLLNALSLFIKPSMKIVSIEDSVTGDSSILTVKNGAVSRTTIGELVESQIEKYGGEVLFDKDRCVNHENISIFCMDREGRIRLSPASSFIRHKTEKEILEIRTRTGRSIKVTGDHSLFSLDGEGNIAPAEVRSLARGSFIAVPKFMPPSRGIEYVNILGDLGKLRGLYVTGKEIGDLPAEKLGDASPMKKRWWKRYRVIPVDVFGRLDQHFGIDGLFVKSKHSRPLPVKICMDGDFLSFLGLWIAEGCYDKNSIIVSNGDEECKDVVRRIGSRFNIPVKVHSDKFSLMLNSSMLKRVMQDILGLKGNACTKAIPEWMFNLSNEQIGYLLKGYYSGDGHVSKFEIQSRTSSVELLKGIQALMLRHGIIARQAKFYAKDKTYGLRISSVDMLQKFRDNIGFLQKKKFARLEENCMRTHKHDVTDVVPLPVPFLRELEKAVGGFNTNCYYYGSNIGRKYLKSTTSAFGKENEFIRKASMLANSDIFWDEIASVKHVENTGGYVYDISVPEFENFICENIIAHNTAELRLPHPHWIPEVARTPLSIEGRIGEVSLFDLLKSSMRQRPDYIVLGEVRGKEAFVLFQQMASVPGNEKVLVINDSHLKSVPIAELDGKTYNLPTMDPETGEMKIEPMKMLVQHSPVSELYRITTKTGREIVTSANHSVFTYNGRIEPIVVSEMKEGSKIVVPASVPKTSNGKKPKIRNRHNLQVIGDVFVDEVKKIEKIQLEQPEPVYDISVPGTQNFIGGSCGGVVLHNTGHPSLATIHAATISQLIDRLITPPISLPPSLLENINIIIFLVMSRLHGSYVRRAESILEVVGLKGDRPMTRTIFEWKPLDDSYITSEKSLLLTSISTRQGVSEDTIRNEMMRRKKVLEWMHEQNILDYRDVARVISTYYNNPGKVMDAVMAA